MEAAVGEPGEAAVSAWTCKDNGPVRGWGKD